MLRCADDDPVFVPISWPQFVIDLKIERTINTAATTMQDTYGRDRI